MGDNLSKEQRSARMRRIRSKDTKPEMAVRRLVHALGYRYRLHDRKIHGTPDLAFPSRRKLIMVHGCFWHLHPGCKQARLPKSRIGYWGPKLKANRARDARIKEALVTDGWAVLVLWECELASYANLKSRIFAFLE